MKSTFEKVALVVLGISILGYLYYTYYLSNQIASIKEIRKDIDATKQTIHSLDNEKKTINAKIEQEKNRSSEVNDAVPNNFDKKEIIKYLYELIKVDGLKSEKVALTESISKDYKSGTASFKVTGNYESIRNFMKQIENDKRKFVIKQSSMGEDEAGYSVTMTVEFYALK